MSNISAIDQYIFQHPSLTDLLDDSNQCYPLRHLTNHYLNDPSFKCNTQLGSGFNKLLSKEVKALPEEAGASTGSGEAHPNTEVAQKGYDAAAELCEDNLRNHRNFHFTPTAERSHGNH